MWRWDKEKEKGKEQDYGVEKGRPSAFFARLAFRGGVDRQPSTASLWFSNFQGSASRVGWRGYDDRHAPKTRPRVNAHLPNRNRHCEAEGVETRAD